MKKIIGASVALLALTSCGAPTIQSPTDALQQNQSALVQNIEKLQKLTPEQAKSVGSVAIEVIANEGTANGTIAYDFQANQATYETTGNLQMDMQLKANNPAMAEMDMSGNLNLDLITLKNKVLFKLNSLEINSADQNNQIAMMSAMTAPFQKNWYFIDNAAENPIMALQQELLTKQKEVIALMKKHTMLSHVSTNENENFYDYEVQLNEEGVINFMKDLEQLGQTENNTGSLLTTAEIEDIKSGVSEFNKKVKANIKIDKSNLEYFTLTFTHTDGSVIIENTKKNFNLTMNDTAEKITVALLGTKSKTKFDAIITVVGEKDENETINLIDGSMSIGTDGKKSNMTLSLLVKDEYSDEELKINISASDTTTAQSVEITEPTDAKNFQEVIMQMMGDMMGTPVDMEIGYDEMNINNTQINKDTPELEYEMEFEPYDKMIVAPIGLDESQFTNIQDK